MAQQQMTTSTEKYIESSDGLNNSTKIEKTTKVITTEETIKTKKYKYQFSNINIKQITKIIFNQNQKSNNNKLNETENSTVLINSTNDGKNSQNYAIENSNFNYRYDKKPLTESSNINTNNKSYINNKNYMEKYLTEKSENDANNLKNSNNIRSQIIMK